MHAYAHVDFPCFPLDFGKEKPPNHWEGTNDFKRLKGRMFGLSLDYILFITSSFSVHIKSCSIIYPLKSA